jgi:diadenylate cyclase
MPDILSNLWDSGGWFSTVLDFVIVFYLIYLILLLVRGTRTVPMVLGLVVIVVFYLLSQKLRLATTYMLLDQFMEVAVIFALIIFQDDIRRALVRMGRFPWMLKAKQTQVVEDVVRAASSLAQKSLGAIIVFERDASLDEFIDKGTLLDAAVSRELLYTIFIPRMENPLHDGAVIIKNLRIKEAGALLPLSGNMNLGKSYGTRHRAALGITEETDAVSVVVSEERGTMSLCFEGRMSKNLDAESLRRALYGLFSEEKNRERRKAAEERKGMVQAMPKKNSGLSPASASGSSESREEAASGSDAAKPAGNENKGSSGESAAGAASGRQGDK